MNKITVFIVSLFSIVVMTNATSDPTQPANFKAEGEEIKLMPLKVSMIVKRGRRYHALVAGESVVVGSKVRGYTVTRITSNKVILKRAGEKNSLVLELTQKIKGTHAY